MPMKYLFKIMVFATLSLMLADCADDARRLRARSIYTGEAVDARVEAILVEWTPAEAAEAMVDWLSVSPDTVRPYARQLAAALSAGYGSDAFALALDSIGATLPCDVKARVLTVIASPGRLGVALRGDDEAESLVPCIEREYASDTAALRLFRKSLDITP